MQLSLDQIKALLKEDAQPKKRGGARGPRKDPTEPRELGVWMKLQPKIAEFEDEDGNMVVPHCENPDCKDPRPKTSIGRNVVNIINGKMMCRYCFLAGWLSENKNV